MPASGRLADGGVGLDLVVGGMERVEPLVVLDLLPRSLLLLAAIARRQAVRSAALPPATRATHERGEVSVRLGGIEGEHRGFRLVLRLILGFAWAHPDVPPIRSLVSGTRQSMGSRS